MASLGGPGTVATPLVLILVASVAMAVATRGLGWNAGSDEPIVATLQRWIIVIAAFAPVVALIKAAVLAAVVWSLLVLLGTSPPMKPMLSALLYGEALLALQAPCLLLVIVARGGPDGGALPSLGLDAFVDPGHPILAAIAGGFTPFQIAWVAYLALAFASSARTSRTRGLVASGALWALITALGALRAFLATGGT